MSATAVKKAKKAAGPVVTKNYPVKRGIPQIMWLLKKHGPMTIWEIVDRIKSNSPPAPEWRSVQRSLHLLRTKGFAGVVNYKDEPKRIKKASYPYWAGYAQRERARAQIGNVVPGKVEEVEVWALFL